MTTQISTQTISFYGSELITLKVEDVIYTAVRPIVEALGLAWGTQQQKLSRSKDKFGCIHMNTPTNGGMQSMLCMPLKKLNGWLFSINPEKVRPDLKDRVIQYQEECFEALYNYWHFGKAERKQPKEQEFTHTLKNSEAVDLAWLWFEAEQMVNFIGKITPALEVLGSHLAPTAHSIRAEYGSHIKHIGKLVYRLSVDADFERNPRPMTELRNSLKQNAIAVRRNF